MTHEEMKQKVADIERVARLQKKAVYREYVKSNAKYKIGDIICNSVYSIKITSVEYVLVRGDIEILYNGILLTKQLKPRKDGSERCIYEKTIRF